MNSKSQMSNCGSGNAVVVLWKLNGIAKWQCGNGGKGGGLYMVSELEAWSLSSRNTLGDTTHNTNKIGLSWVGGSVWWASLCGSYGGG